jgi:hypothetical protein
MTRDEPVNDGLEELANRGDVAGDGVGGENLVTHHERVHVALLR